MCVSLSTTRWFNPLLVSCSFFETGLKSRRKKKKTELQSLFEHRAQFMNRLMVHNKHMKGKGGEIIYKGEPAFGPMHWFIHSYRNWICKFLSAGTSLGKESIFLMDLQRVVVSTPRLPSAKMKRHKCFVGFVTFLCTQEHGNAEREDAVIWENHCKSDLRYL